VIDMNRRLVGDTSLNDPVREGRDSAEWQDWLVGESPDQETMLAAGEEFDDRHNALSIVVRSTRGSGAFLRAGAWSKTRSRLLS
jgi:DNA-directed RNA polymerase sigma subunit (sigma70/sigma32)